MKRASILVAAGLAMSTSAFAGTITASGGTATYDHTEFGTIWNTINGQHNLRPGGGATTDHLYSNLWTYRTQANNTNTLFGFFSPNTLSDSGNTLTATWLDNGPGVTGNARFDANFSIKVEQGANSTQARVNTVLVITARAANTAARNFSIFNVVDMDLGGTAASDSATLGNSNQTFSWLDAGGTTGEHSGYGASRWESGSGSTLRSKIASGSNNLASTVGSGTDLASGFQWDFNLAPGQSATIYASFSVNMASIPTPGSMALLGLGGLVAGRRRR